MQSTVQNRAVFHLSGTRTSSNKLSPIAEKVTLVELTESTSKFPLQFFYLMQVMWSSWRGFEAMQMENILMGDGESILPVTSCKISDRIIIL